MPSVAVAFYCEETDKINKATCKSVSGPERQLLPAISKSTRGDLSYQYHLSLQITALFNGMPPVNF